MTKNLLMFLREFIQSSVQSNIWILWKKFMWNLYIGIYFSHLELGMLIWIQSCIRCLRIVEINRVLLISCWNKCLLVWIYTPLTSSVSLSSSDCPSSLSPSLILAFSLEILYYLRNGVILGWVRVTPLWLWRVFLLGTRLCEDK